MFTKSGGPPSYLFEDIGFGNERMRCWSHLRMNRKFMEYMRGKYNHLSLQQFGKTIVG